MFGYVQIDMPDGKGGYLIPNTKDLPQFVEFIQKVESERGNHVTISEDGSVVTVARANPDLKAEWIDATRPDAIVEG